MFNVQMFILLFLALVTVAHGFAATPDDEERQSRFDLFDPLSKKVTSTNGFSPTSDFLL